jgi:lipoyl synthase
MKTKTRPAWLDKKISLKSCNQMKSFLRGLSLHTVCEEAACPNISECFERGVATFMILGKNCTRSCRFCNISKQKPSPIDRREPLHVAEAVRALRLKHVVVTSVTRDDLEDAGAGHFAATIKAIKSLNNDISVEVLIPDFKGDRSAIKEVAEAGPDIINHNIETIPRFYPEIRPEADYQKSLDVLSIARELSDNSVSVKSGIMLGFGEKRNEVLDVFKDLRHNGCELLSIGQYLSPSKAHYPVKEYVMPEVFDYYRNNALALGFSFVKSSPYTRSSYLADEYMQAKK